MSKKHQTGRTTQMLRRALSCGINASPGKKILIVGANARHIGIMADTLMKIATAQMAPLTWDRRYEFSVEDTGTTLRFVTSHEYYSGRVTRGVHYTNVFIDHYCLEVRQDG